LTVHADPSGQRPSAVFATIWIPALSVIVPAHWPDESDAATTMRVMMIKADFDIAVLPSY
jgi:hypothetical protein